MSAFLRALVRRCFTSRSKGRADVKPLSRLFLALVFCAAGAAQTPNHNPTQQFSTPMPTQASQVPRSTLAAAPQPNVAATNAQVPSQTSPCGQQAVSAAGKHFNWKPPKSVLDLWDKEKKQIQDKTGLDIGSMPSADSLKSAAKPCPPANGSQITAAAQSHSASVLSPTASASLPQSPSPASSPQVSQATVSPSTSPASSITLDDVKRMLQQRCGVAAIPSATPAATPEEILKLLLQPCATATVASTAATAPKQ